MNKQKEEENEIDVEFLEAIEGIDGDEEILLPVQVVHQVVSSDEGTTLSIIQQEILNIRKKQLQGIELTFADTKKLETLGNIKTKIKDSPIPEPVYDYSQVSDKDILEVLKKKVK